MGNKIVQPEGWAPAKGYANGILTEGKTLYIGGQIGWNSEKIFEEKDFIGQMEQVLKNIKEIIEAAGGRVENIVRLTWFIIDRVTTWLTRALLVLLTDVSLGVISQPCLWL